MDVSDELVAVLAEENCDAIKPSDGKKPKSSIIPSISKYSPFIELSAEDSISCAVSVSLSCGSDDESVLDNEFEDEDNKEFEEDDDADDTA